MPESVIPPAAGRMKQSSTILIVEDDAAIGRFLQQLIEDETPYTSILLPDGFRALEQARQIRPCLFLLDYRLPGMNGVEVFDRLQTMEETRGVPAIMMSATLPTEELQKRGIYQLRKPMDIGNVIRMITHAVATFQERELERQQQYS
ncbi:MAG TPA: response regulator [Ktedonobacteraceae bacterium]|nr:response regulator [Ktedonobacteraceae bacterium]